MRKLLQAFKSSPNVQNAARLIKYLNTHPVATMTPEDSQLRERAWQIITGEA